MSSDLKKQSFDIVCFAGCDWWYHNRGLFVPQVMSRLQKYARVLFVNSLGMRIPSLTGDRDALQKIARKLKSISRFLKKDKNGMYVFSPISCPFHGKVGKALNRKLLQFQMTFVMKHLRIQNPIYYIGCPPAWEIIKDWPRKYLIYEKTDLFEEMPGANKSYIASLDQELVARANLVLYANKALWEQDRSRNPNGLLLGHGVDYERFASADSSPHIPEDIASIPKPIVGFFGDLTEDVCDFSLIACVARQLPEVSFVFVGPISSDITMLREFDNIYFLGQKPYEQVPHYGKVFDVAMMPWKQNRWIQFCNPIKTKEYLALGKPIVSIDYPELKPFYEVVYPARSCDEFVLQIRKALLENSPELKKARQQRVQNETWDNKVRQIVDSIERGIS